MVLNAMPLNPQSKPPTAVNRQLQTRKFPRENKLVLKAAIGSLQDLDYTIDVLNSDIGLITASRTTEKKEAEVSPTRAVALAAVLASGAPQPSVAPKQSSSVAICSINASSGTKACKQC